MVIQRDWSKLPSELLEQIAGNVLSVSDCIRFRSVCRSWRKAATLPKLRPQLPILHLPYNILNSDRYFFSTATGQTHHISLPQLVGKKIFAAANGWMLLSDTQLRTLSLHNPLSSANVPLPPTANLVHRIGNARLFYDKFTDKFVVLVREYTSPRMWFCKVGDESWSVLKFSLDVSANAIIYHEGKFIANVGGSIYINDFSAASSGHEFTLAGSVVDIPECMIDSHFIIANDQLFLVFGYVDNGYSFYRIDFDGQQIKWSEVRFEDCAVLISVAQPYMFCVKDSPRFKKSHVYTPGTIFRDVEEHKITEVVGIMDCDDVGSNFVLCGWKIPADSNREYLWMTLGFQ